MIKSREERKKSSLLRRRTIIIIVSIVLVLASGISLYFVNSYINNVIPFVDPADNVTYYVKKTNGEWKMYDKDGNLLKTEEQYGYYITASSTCIKLDPETGELVEKILLDTSEGEVSTEYDKVLIFPQISRKDIRSIKVHNQINTFTFLRYDTTNGINDKAEFVLDYLPHLPIREEVIPDICNAAGFPLAAMRVDEAKKLENGKIDLAEYGLAPEKRTRIEKDANGNDITVEYDYTPNYYILTTVAKKDKDGKYKNEQHKVLIGDRLVNNGGYYAQYIKINEDGTETPRNTLYVLGTSIKYTLLEDRKIFVTPGTAFPVTQNDYFDVTDFVIRKKNDKGTYDSTVSFSYIDIADRTGTVAGSRPYVFTDGRSKSYMPNYDRIDSCLLSFMQPNIVEIAVLDPTEEERAKYGLMKEVLDENGNPKLDEYGKKVYKYDAPYVVTFDRTAKADDGSKIPFRQTIYISPKPNSSNYYSFTTITILDNENKVNEKFNKNLKLSMLCEVSGETYNFLKYDEYDWTYPYILETGIKYATNVTITKPDYTATFNIQNTTSGEHNAIKVVGSCDTNGKTADTFDMLIFTDVAGRSWYIGQNDAKGYAPDGKTEIAPASGRFKGINDIGEKVTYYKESILVNNGVINKVDVNINDVTVYFVNGTKKTYVRYQTMIFKKFYQSVNSLSIVDNYELSKEEEAALIADKSKYLATVTLTNNEGHTTTVEFYELTARKAYVVVNGEGGYYVSTSAIQKIFENSEKFFDCRDIVTD